MTVERIFVGRKAELEQYCPGTLRILVEPALLVHAIREAQNSKK